MIMRSEESERVMIYAFGLFVVAIYVNAFFQWAKPSLIYKFVRGRMILGVNVGSQMLGLFLGKNDKRLD